MQIWKFGRVGAFNKVLFAQRSFPCLTATRSQIDLTTHMFARARVSEILIVMTITLISQLRERDEDARRLILCVCAQEPAVIGVTHKNELNNSIQ
jgi:hypothetical protein